MDQARVPFELLGRVQRIALIVGAVGMVAGLAGLALGYERFMQSYLFAYVFWLLISLGGLVWTMINHTVGGRWGLASRRIFEAIALTVPLMAVLFIPVLIAVLLPTLGFPAIYEWSDPAIAAADPIIAWKAPYLNVPFWIARTVFYFAVWISMAYYLNKWSLAQEQGDASTTGRMRTLSAPGILLFALTLNFAMTDWTMSLEAHWFSTMYGVIMAITGMQCALCITILTMVRLKGRGVIASKLVSADHFHDLGKLLFAFVILWTYTSFSQYIITWSGNVSEFASYYVYRSEGGWQIFGPLLTVSGFFFPFFYLLPKITKRRYGYLTFITIWLMVIQVINLYWIVAPAFQWGEAGEAHVLNTTWTDIALPIGIGGLWIWYYSRQLADRPLLTLREPRITELYGEPATPMDGSVARV